MKARRSPYLVYQNDRFPARGDIENFLELNVEPLSACAEIASADDIKGTPDMFASRLGGKRLPDAGRAK